MIGLASVSRTWHLPLELFDEMVLLEELSGRASHGQDILSDPRMGGGASEMHKTWNIPALRTKRTRYQVPTFSMILTILEQFSYTDSGFNFAS